MEKLQKEQRKGRERFGRRLWMDPWFGDGSVEIGKIGDTRLSLVSSNGQNVREFDKGQTAIPISALKYLLFSSFFQLLVVHIAFQMDGNQFAIPSGLFF